MRSAGSPSKELAEGMRRGWAERDCRAAMLLQEERAGVAARVSPERMPGALKD
jgi:3-hydroxyisobutyrate dehydrogenase